jgi:hypothetical protein
VGRGSWFVGRGSWFVVRGSWVVVRGSWDKRRLSNVCTNKSQPRPRPQPHSNHDANHGPVVYLVSREALARDEHPRVHDLYLTHVTRGVVGHVEVDHEVAPASGARLLDEAVLDPNDHDALVLEELKSDLSHG